MALRTTWPTPASICCRRSRCGATLLALPIVWTSLQWATYSVEQGGEIKGARVFKNQMFIIVGSMIAMGCSLALIAWAEERAVGTAFFNAVSHSYYYGVSASGDGIGSVLPFPGMFAIVISTQPDSSRSSWRSASCSRRCRSPATATSA